jgi:SHS2 domain-containing protein
MEPSVDRGHAVRAHTADAVIEAWGPTAAACYEEAAAAFVAVFADTDACPAGSAEAFDVGPGRPQDLLVLLLEEVLFDADARGHIPTVTELEVRGDHLVGTFTTVPIEEIDVTGAVPKGVSYSDLEFGRTDGGWRCRATVDV